MSAIGDIVDNRLTNETRFIGFVIRIVQGDQITFVIRCPQVLAESTDVFVNQGICSIEDIAGRAIVLFETDQLRAGEILVEVKDVLNTRAAPGIDGLIIIANRKDTTGFTGKQTNPCVLNGVGILKFINQQMLETLAIVLEQAGVIAKRFQCA